MTASEISALITGSGVAGIWILCIIIGAMYPRSSYEEMKEHYREQIEDKDEQIREYKEAIKIAEQRADAERKRGDAAVEAANTSNLLLAGIRRGIASGEMER